MHIILSSNGTPFHGAKGGYPSQLKHLIKMFVEEGHSVTMVMWSLCGVKHTRVLFYRDLVNHNILSDEIRDPHTQALLDRPEVSLVLSPYDTFPTEIKIDEINRIVSETNASLIFFLQDIFLLERDPSKKINCPSYIWFPLHYDPIDEPTKDIISNKIDHIISLCPSTSQRLQEQMNKESSLVPHIIGFNTPLGNEYTKERIKREFRLENKFVVGTIAGNYEESGRKSIDTTLLSFKEFYSNHKNSVLWIHAPLLNNIPIYHVYKMVKELGFEEGSVKITENTMDEVTLQKFYLSLDCYLCGSCSEGFGIPQLEAQYLGVPVVTTQFGAMDDYCWNGVSVPYAHRKYNPMQKAWWVHPSVIEMAKGMELIFKGEYKDLSEETKVRISETMSYEVVKKKLLAILEKK